eukprot:813806-Pyramimonas_sp.AAC.1
MAATPRSGLALNFPERVIVIPRPFDPPVITRQCVSTGLDITGLNIEQSGMHFGAEVGTDAPESA